MALQSERQAETLGRAGWHGLVVRLGRWRSVLLLTAFSLSRHQAEFGPVPVDYGTVEGLGSALYRGAMAPFEMVSITLLVAVVGAVAISRVRTAREKESDAADAEARKLAKAGGNN